MRLFAGNMGPAQKPRDLLEPLAPQRPPAALGACPTAHLAFPAQLLPGHFCLCGVKGSWSGNGSREKREAAGTLVPYSGHARCRRK